MKQMAELDIGIVLTLIGIGVLAGVLSGFVGVGGGLIIVPALIYFMGFNQFMAQGTSLAVLLLPVGILAVMNYHKTDNVNVNYALIIGAAFVLGGFIGSKLALNLPENTVKFVFGLIMLYAAVRILWSSGAKVFN
ncbi:MAG: sulfite exporter TauE/SafE family protein [Flavobacteriales bacterium]|nr:sulfite exporter TauE/SafE family protein [Flavobacteriales bacterium]